MIWLILLQVQFQCPEKMPCFNHRLKGHVPVVPKQISGLGRNHTLITFQAFNCHLLSPDGCLWTTLWSTDFLSEDLAAYKCWWSTIAQNLCLPATAETRYQKLLELLGLDHHYLIICDALASHESSQWKRSLQRLLSLSLSSSKRWCRRLTFKFDEASTSIDRTGLRRMLSSWFRGSRTSSKCSKGSIIYICILRTIRILHIMYIVHIVHIYA